MNKGNGILKRICICAMLMILTTVLVVPVYAAGKLNRTNIIVCTGQKFQLKLSGEKTKKKWKSSNKKIATVSGKGKITAKKAGTAEIKVQAGRNIYSCNVVVESPKMSKNSISICKNEKYSLRVNGTQQTYKWSSKKKSIATVDANGTVTGKKAGTTYIYAKSASGKSFKCKVKVKNKTVNVNNNTIPNTDTNTAITLENGITYHTEDTVWGAVAIFENHNSCAVDMSVDCIYYLNGSMINKSSDSNYCFEANSKCAMRFWNNDSTWDSYKLNLHVEKTSSTLVENVKNINLVTSTRGNDNVMAVVNNSGVKNEYTQLAVVYYKNGKIIGFDDQFAEVKLPGTTDYLQFSLPYGRDYKTIVPDSYEIYTNFSYTYTWLTK